MSLERTLSILKPDTVASNRIGNFCSYLEKAGLRIIASKMKHLTRQEAEGFYAVHRERPFFKDLVNFMISGPCLLMVLEGENAVARNREIMGATDPQKAAPGTLRRDFCTSIDQNGVHGSDSLDNAKIEVAYFFSTIELCPRV